MNDNDFTLGKKLQEAAQEHCSTREVNFDRLWKRTRVKYLRLSWAVLPLASAAAFLILTVSLWPTFFPSAEALAYQESVKSFAQEIMPTNPEPVSEDSETTWTTSLLNSDSDNQDF